MCWALSTLRQYNGYIERFLLFCGKDHSIFPPPDPVIADFLWDLAQTSTKPRSLIRIACAAIGNLYKVRGYDNPLENEVFKMLCDALVKSHSTAPMSYSKVMPTDAFSSLFRGWPSNEELDVRKLRLKAITLLALTAMLRPSDIAPKAEYKDPTSGRTLPIVFRKEQVTFLDNGSIELNLFGVKNDRQRTGFQITVRPINEAKLCPVKTLREYLQRTDKFRSNENSAVFWTLRAPYKHLQADGIARDLEAAIQLAGLDGRGFTAKSFRPTGATLAIEAMHNPEVVRRVGRWKSSEIFFQHYVHARPETNFSSDILHSA